MHNFPQLWGRGTKNKGRGQRVQKCFGVCGEYPPPAPYTPYAMHIFGHIRVSIVLERSSYREDASSVLFTLISDSVLEKALRPDIKEQKTCSIQLFWR
jgi:hypothetical protein